MEKALKLLNLVDNSNFLNVYFVISKPAKDVISIESIAFLTREEAQEQCNYKNRKDNTTMYSVFRTCAHV